MTLLNNLPPAFLLIIGALILVILPATARKVGAITLALFGFYAISQLSEESRFLAEFLCFVCPFSRSGRMLIETTWRTIYS